MKSTDVSPDQTRARFGAGHTLFSTCKSLEKYNLTTLGGRADTVGLWGYTLGGGLSHLSPVYGLAKDNVFEYEVCSRGRLWYASTDLKCRLSLLRLTWGGGV